MRKNKLIGAAIITVSLAAGGIAGAQFGTPSVTSAQDAGGPTTTVDGESATPDGRRCHRRSHHLRHLAIGAAAEALGMTERELRQALRDGGSIADVAAERGVEPQSVIDALVADATARIDAAVAGGRLGAERATEMKDGLAERAAELVNRDRPQRQGRGGPPSGAGSEAPRGR